MTAIHAIKVTVTAISAFHWGEEEQSFVGVLRIGVDFFLLYNKAINLHISHQGDTRGLKYLECLVVTVLHSKFSLSQFSKYQPGMWLVSVSVCQVSHSRKKGYYLVWHSVAVLSLRLQTHARQQWPAGRGPLYQRALYCTCHYSLSGIISAWSGWMRGEYSLWAKMGGGCLKVFAVRVNGCLQTIFFPLLVLMSYNDKNQMDTSLFH